MRIIRAHLWTILDKEVFENLACEHQIYGPETKSRGWDTGSGLWYWAHNLPCMKSIEISDKAPKQGRNGHMLSCTPQLHWVGSVPFCEGTSVSDTVLTLSLENLSYTTSKAGSLSIPCLSPGTETVLFSAKGVCLKPLTLRHWDSVLPSRQSIPLSEVLNWLATKKTCLVLVSN